LHLKSQDVAGHSFFPRTYLGRIFVTSDRRMQLDLERTTAEHSYGYTGTSFQRPWNNGILIIRDRPEVPRETGGGVYTPITKPDSTEKAARR